MRWLLHKNLTPAVGAALVARDDVPRPLDEAGVAPDATAADVLRAAQLQQLDVITADASLPLAIFEEKLTFNRSVVYLQLEGGEVEQDDAIDRLFARYPRLTPGRLYTVTGSRVKIRQLPGVR